MVDVFSGADAVLFAEFRGYGSSTGREMLCLSRALADADNIIPALGVPENKVVVFGRSLGSLFAMRVARKFPNIAGLIIESGIASLESVWGEYLKEPEHGLDTAKLYAEEEKYVAQKRSLQKYQGPVLILHTEDDKLVPFKANAEAMYQWCREARTKPADEQDTEHGVRLVPFPVGGHNYIFHANAEAYCQTVADFLHGPCGFPSPPAGKDEVEDEATCCIY
eukprot:TRINITY_DN8970_c0_g2_i1.p1 TRINITY_DN8970_c0_g2~~TRINITY_DN8970_c0_g2_i1.p1  ORF type:complete len:222 (+),score=56.43 TRINITY_DN8970_c0_g2_i1:467-1132(+)